MAALIGLMLAIGVAVGAHAVRFDRERVFYPVILIVIASYYVLFATVSGSETDIAMQALLFFVFATAAVVGFRSSLWVVVAGLAAHGLFDFLWGAGGGGAGVPSWWPSFCLAYDLAAAAALSVLLLRFDLDHVRNVA